MAFNNLTCGCVYSRTGDEYRIILRQWNIFVSNSGITSPRIGASAHGKNNFCFESNIFVNTHLVTVTKSVADLNKIKKYSRIQSLK